MNRIRTLAVGAALGGLVLGCQSDGSGGGVGGEQRAVDHTADHDWPPVSLDSSGREHVIVMQGPHPGWGLDLDAVQSTRGGKVVYATVRQPDPERMYPQVIRNVRLGTTVPSTEPVELVVRLSERDGSAAGPYRPAARVE